MNLQKPVFKWLGAKPYECWNTATNLNFTTTAGKLLGFL